MKKTLFTAAALAVLLIAGLSVSGVLKAGEPKDAPAFDQKDVDKAIEKGMKYLLRQMDPKTGAFPGNYSRGYPMGYNALCALTLLKCGLSPRHRAVRLMFKNLKDMEPRKTYSVGLYLMALEALYYHKEFLKKHEKKHKKKHGMTSVKPKPFKPKVGRPHRIAASKLADWLVKNQAPCGSWGYSKPVKSQSRNAQGQIVSDEIRTDNSNMQYAVLGLKAASRLGVKLPPQVFLKNLKYLEYTIIKGRKGDVEPFSIPAAHLNSFEEQKEPEGGYTGLFNRPERNKFSPRGWTYYVKSGEKPSKSYATKTMTPAGLAAVIIAKSELLKYPKLFDDRQQKKTNEIIEDACAWIAANFTVTPFTGHYYYYMYGIERAGALSGCREFGEHDWYREGVPPILKLQKDDGRWENVPYKRPNRPQPNNNRRKAPKQVDLTKTCFALLFLKRATISVIPEKVILTGAGLLKPAKKDPKTEPDKKDQPAEKDETGKTPFFGMGVTLDAAGRVAVFKVIPGSPADKAGLKPGDVVTLIDDTKINKPADFGAFARTLEVGRVVTVHFERGGVKRNTKVTIAARPAE